MKKVFIFLFIGMLVIYQPIKVYADAGSLVVVGGSIGTGGLAVAGLAGLSGPAVVIVFTALMACGMNVELTRASQEAGMSKTEFVKNKIKQYCTDANISLGTFCNYVLSETKITKNGLIELGRHARTQITMFGNWLFSNNDVYDNSNAGSANTITLGGVALPYGNISPWFMLNRQQQCYYTTVNCAYIRTSATGSTDAGSVYLFCKDANASFGRAVLGTPYDSVTKNYSIGNIRNGYYWAVLSGTYGGSDIPIIPLQYNNSITSFLDSLDGSWSPGVLAPENDTFTGKSSDWDNTKGNINTGVLNPGLNPGLDIPQDSDLTTSVQDYLDALKDVIDGVANPDITVRDEVTGIPADIPIDIPDVDDPALENPDPTIPDEDKTPVMDPSVPADPNVAIEPLTIQLKGVFPFCIPFDYVDMLKLLKSNAVAPSFTVNWTIPIVNTNLNFTVDLSPYNNVAAILRKMELLAFCIALAIATRAMFIRG